MKGRAQMMRGRQSAAVIIAAATVVAGLTAMPVLAQDAAAPSTESIGVNLNGLVLLGPTEQVRSNGAGNVTTDGILIVSGDVLAARLRPLLGRPLSEALIADIQAEIVSAYRNVGFPFVAVSTPPQEITSGVLNLRVVPFKAADITASGTTPAVASLITAGIRQQQGAAIDAQQLEQDLEWLNRTPLRRIAAEFSPGTALSTTNITLAVTEGQRFQFNAGYSNTGSISTGSDRLSFGATVGDLFFIGSSLSYRATVGIETSPDGGPSYLGQTLQYTVPIGARQELSVLLSLTDTTEEPDFFIVESQTQEIVLSYGAALSNFYDLPGDIRIALESRDQTKDVFFGEDIFLGQDAFTARQIVIGYSTQWRSSRPGGPNLRHEIEGALHVSPGDLGDNNSDPDITAFTSGRVTSASYTFVTGGYDLNLRLGNGHRVTVGLDGQWTSDPLPDTEQLAIGGLEAVRGYASEDGAYDRGIILRSEYGLTDEPVTAGPFKVNPYLFADAAFGTSIAYDVTDTIAGAGIGASVGIGTFGSGSVVLGVPLIDGPANDAGDVRLHINVNFRF